MFARLAEAAGLAERAPGCRPTLHGLRHSFAVRALIKWHHDGVDVQARLPLLSTYMGHVNPASTYWYLSAAPELLARVAAGSTPFWSDSHDPARPSARGVLHRPLLCQQGVIPNTIASYRDTFRLLLTFAQQQTGRSPARLELTQLDATMIAAFLGHLESDRSNSPHPQRSPRRHPRVLSLLRAQNPEHAALIARVLAIPAKRHEKRTVTFLTLEETKALLDSPDRSTWTGRRDHALLLCAVQTGLRVSDQSSSGSPTPT